MMWWTVNSFGGWYYSPANWKKGQDLSKYEPTPGEIVETATASMYWPASEGRPG